MVPEVSRDITSCVHLSYCKCPESGSLSPAPGPALTLESSSPVIILCSFPSSVFLTYSPSCLNRGEDVRAGLPLLHLQDSLLPFGSYATLNKEYLHHFYCSVAKFNLGFLRGR